MKNLLIIFIALLFSCLVKADDNLKIHDLIIKQAIDSNHPATIYLNIENLGNKLDYLLAVEIADHPEAIVTINKTVIEQNVARIIKIDRLTIPAESTINLAPLGIYLVARNLPATQSIKIKFIFSNAQEVIYSKEM